MAIQSIIKSKILFKNNKPNEVVLRWADFQELLEKFEDFYDLAEIKKIKKKEVKFKNIDIFAQKYASL